MTIKEWIKNKIMKFLGIEKLSESPNDDRLTYISNAEEIKISEIRANKIWYIGNGDELLNYYTQKQSVGFADNPIYNRNKRNYFWSLSASECDIKRVHSGIPNAIITTLSNVIDYPQIKEPTGQWDAIEKENDFRAKITQQSRPLTMAEGWGAWKVNINSELSEYPLWEFYEAEYVEYIYKCGVMIGIVFKSYYQKDTKNYVLIETRYKAKGNSYIEYNLFELGKNNDISEAKLDELPELCDIPRETTVIEGLNRILAVPSRYFFDAQNPKYGKSIYAGKLDLFDDLDLILSQESQTIRVSTPVEYYSPEVIGRGANGQVGMPPLFNRQFVQKSGIPDGDGNMNSDIVTTQPQLNIDQYSQAAKAKLDMILTGTLSPATMGIDIAKKDNADAQREKEKVTIQTRNNVINSETIMMTGIVELSLMMQEYMQTGQITLKDDFDISVKYNEFANPSFENELQILGGAWLNGEISTEKYVDILWSDKLSDEDKSKEVQWLDDNKAKDDIDLEGMLGNGMGTGISESENEQEEVPEITQ